MNSMAPQVRELDEKDIAAVLARNHMGQLAFTRGGRIDIRPIHYIYSDGTIYGRTSYGAKFDETTAPPEKVAFEADEVESIFRWCSVIVQGRFQVLTREGGDGEKWERAVGLVRKLVRTSFKDDDPVPHRTVLIRITIEEVTGRAMG